MGHGRTHHRVSARSVPWLLAAGLMASCTGGAGPATTVRRPPAAASTSAVPTPATTPHPTPGPAAPTTSPPTAEVPCGRAGAAPARYRHVVWIWMENHTWRQVLGDPRSAPYESALETRCGTDTSYASVGSPSLPNYLGATSGQTWGIHDDGDPAVHPLAVDNLFRQVRTAGGTERSFEESMAGSCRLTSGTGYAPKHNPAAYYRGAGDRAACAADDVSLDGLSAALAAGTLPTFAFVTPNLCHDTHDCGVATGDAWLAEWMPRLLADPAYRDGSTAIFIVWDEDTPMPNLVVAPTVPAGLAASRAVDHFSLLRTTEELLGLPLLGRAAAAASLRGVFGL